MFEIHGFFQQEDLYYLERLKRHLTSYTVRGEYQPEQEDQAFIPIAGNIPSAPWHLFDLIRAFDRFQDNIALLRSTPGSKILVLPPFPEVVRFYEPFCEKIILSFYVKRRYWKANNPHLSIPELKQVLLDFSQLKHKILIELTGSCLDFDLRSGEEKTISTNKAVLTSAERGSNIFLDRTTGCPYFTYRDKQDASHIVWLENTQSLSEKHNLIKAANFRGICWDSPFLACDGNWEALSAIFKKKDFTIENAV